MIESQIPVDHYEAALEASCETLVTMEAIRAWAMSRSAEAGHIVEQTTRAIRSQRQAIAELRLARDEPRKTIFGFVLGAAAAGSGSVAPLSSQSKPRRTA